MAETQTIQFDLVSPEENLVSTPVTLATIPGEAGEFGVGVSHTALVSSLRPGVIAIHAEEGSAPLRYFIAGGFADVTGTGCTILAEEAIKLEDLDQAALEQQLTNLNEDLPLAEEEADKRRISRDITITKAKLSAVTGALVL